MRIDKYLKLSRLIKRRTIAQQICEAGRVKVNDQVVKPAFALKVNDVIEYRYGEHTMRCRVLRLDPNPKKEVVKEMYEIL